jgi:hypothetical protein
MSIYLSLRKDPPKLEVKENAREIIITFVSCMCDNVSHMYLKKDQSGDFKLRTDRNAFSNWQLKYYRHDVEWSADERDWDEVFKQLNSGTSAIQKIRVR